MADEAEHPVRIYAASFLAMSVCAPGSMTIEEVIADCELQRPCGTERGWTMSKDTHFASGQPNPCPCNKHEGRQHWLLDA